MQNLFGEQSDHMSFVYGLHPDIQGIFNVAYVQGTGDALQSIYHAARRHGLNITPYQKTANREPTLGITPPDNGSDYLMRIRARPEAGNLKIYLYTDVFSTYYDVSESEVASVLGGKGWIHCRADHVADFVARLDKLFAIIESEQREQVGLSDVIVSGKGTHETESPTEAPTNSSPQTTYVEGAQLDEMVTNYQRNPAVRQECIDSQGVDCVICGFNFEEVYGEIGAGFIHVHHLNPLAEYSDEHEVKPDDLVPVCPNCHNMLHRRRKTPYTWEELRRIVQCD